MGFGSGVVEPETGIVLQNRGHLFSLDENHPNCIGPHKRCVHTLMPGLIIKDGRPFAALGLKGGHVQPQVQVQIITNLIDFGMTVQESIAAPRFNHIEGLKVGLEPSIPETTVEELKCIGHQIVSGNPESFAGAHAIMIHPESGAFIGGSDPLIPAAPSASKLRIAPVWFQIPGFRFRVQSPNTVCFEVCRVHVIINFFPL